jgi:hypothetical protein
MSHRNYGLRPRTFGNNNVGRNLTELADLIRLVVRNPDDEVAVQRLKVRLRKSDTAEFTKALILVMLVAHDY